MKQYCQEKDKVLSALQTDGTNGLTVTEAKKRLEENGKNKLAAAKKKSLVRRFFEQLADPMIIILIVAAAVSGVLAIVENEGFADVIIILAVVILNAVLGVFQESKAEKAIEALQEMSAATSKVIRDGKLTAVPSVGLGVGDIILLEAGDAVPADARILESASLKIEEAALTGESVPVNKITESIRLKDGEKDVPLGDRKNMAYMGSTVVYGRLPLMLTERCFTRETHGCEQCGKGMLTDRRSMRFPMLREYLHRNLICNSLPTYMGDKQAALAGTAPVGEHFIFTIETPDEAARVLQAYRSGRPLAGQVRRIAAAPALKEKKHE